MRKNVMQKKVMRVFNNRLMMMIGLSFIIYHLSFSEAQAQTFTQQVQQHRSGEGTVTIHHDADIDRLVNAAHTTTKTTTNATKPSATAKPSATPKPSATATPKPSASTKPAASTASTKPTAPTKATTKPKAEKPKAEKPKAEKPKKPQDDTTQTKPLADTTRTTPQEDTVPVSGDTTAIPPGPRHGYKTTGYRVQAFAGGNTRRDRQMAERTGNAIRQLFPGEDVYVRFYSPRWVCRVGNYRTYEEAHEKMLAIRKMGYESATIVKGKIIVYTTPTQF